MPAGLNGLAIFSWCGLAKFYGRIRPIVEPDLSARLYPCPEPTPRRLPRHNTGRLTAAGLDAVLIDVRRFVDLGKPGATYASYV